MGNKYVSRTIFLLIGLSILGCTSLTRKHSDAIANNVTKGNCYWLEKNITVVSEDPQIFKEHKGKIENYRNNCQKNKQIKNQNKIAEQKRLDEQHKRLMAKQERKKQVEWDYIKDRVISLENRHLVNVGQIVCGKTTFQYGRSTYNAIIRGAITIINGNNYHVTPYSVHRVLGADGFEQGSIYHNRTASPEWHLQYIPIEK